jgi:hypothetical protein
MTCGEALHNNHLTASRNPQPALPSRRGELDPGYWISQVAIAVLSGSPETRPDA